MIFYKKISTIIDGSLKKYILVLLLLLTFATLLEIVSLALIIPLIYIVIDNPIGGLLNLANNFNLNEHFINYLKSLKKIDQKLITYFILILFVLIYFLKNLFLLVLNYLSATFIAKTNVFLSKQAVNFFIKSKYENIIKFNFSNLFSTVLNEINVFTYGVLYSLINIISELTVLFSILILLVIIEGPQTLIVFAFLISSSLVFLLFVKKRIKFWGKQRQKYDKEKIDILEKTIRSIKDIKFYRLEKVFLSLFINKDLNLSLFQRNNTVVQNLPKLLLEFIIVLTISIYIAISKSLTTSNLEPLVVIALYAAFAVRLLPSLNKIMFNFQSFIYSKPSVERLFKYKKKLTISKGINLKKENNIESKKIEFKNQILLNNISFGFKKKLIIHKLKLKIKKKDCIGIFGASGSGKTTLADILSGLLDDYRGKISIDGKIVNKINTLNGIVSYSQQNPIILPETLETNIAFGIRKKDIHQKKIKKIINLCHLNELQNKKFSSIGSNISGGQKQRISIARALYFSNELLILDESTSGLEANLEDKIIKNIKKEFNNISLLIISHNLKSLKNCNKIYEFKNKKLEKKSIKF